MPTSQLYSKENRMNLPIEGSCVCTAIQFRVTDEPLFTYACHCLNCQKQSGSAFKMCTNVLETDFELTLGSPRVYSNGGLRVMVCDRCATTLWYSFAESNILLILSGVLSNKDLRPLAHIWAHRKQAWLNLDDEIPQFNGNHDLRSLWPESSLARAGITIS